MMEEETVFEKKRHGLEYEIQQLKQFIQIKETILEEKKCISPLESSLEKELEEIHKYIRQTIVEKEYLIYQVHEYQRHIIDSEIHENLSIYSPTPSPTHKNTSSLPTFSSSPTKSRQSSMNLSPISSFRIDKSLMTPTKVIINHNHQKNTNKQSEISNKSTEINSNNLFSDSKSLSNQDITMNTSDEIDIIQKNPRELELEQLYDKLCHEKETIIKILIKLMGKTQFQTCLQEANNHSMDLLDYLQITLPQLQLNNQI